MIPAPLQQAELEQMDLVLDPPNPTMPGKKLQTFRVVSSRVGDKRKPTILKWVKQGIFPQPVVINGVLYWYEDEIDDWINNQPRGQGVTPVAAIAARGRQIAQARAAKLGKSNADRNSNGRTPRFIRGTPRFHFVRRAP